LIIENIIKHAYSLINIEPQYVSNNRPITDKMGCISDICHYRWEEVVNAGIWVAKVLKEWL